MIFAIIIIVISAREEEVEEEADVVPISMRNTPQSRQLPTVERERRREREREGDSQINTLTQI